MNRLSVITTLILTSISFSAVAQEEPAAAAEVPSEAELVKRIEKAEEELSAERAKRAKLEREMSRISPRIATLERERYLPRFDSKWTGHLLATGVVLVTGSYALELATRDGNLKPEQVAVPLLAGSIQGAVSGGLLAVGSGLRSKQLKGAAIAIIAAQMVLPWASAAALRQR